jgi:hypothetical protein
MILREPGKTDGYWMLPRDPFSKQYEEIRDPNEVRSAGVADTTRISGSASSSKPTGDFKSGPDNFSPNPPPLNTNVTEEEKKEHHSVPQPGVGPAPGPGVVPNDKADQPMSAEDVGGEQPSPNRPLPHG